MGTLHRPDTLLTQFYSKPVQNHRITLNKAQHSDITAALTTPTLTPQYTSTRPPPLSLPVKAPTVPKHLNNRFMLASVYDQRFHIALAAALYCDDSIKCTCCKIFEMKYIVAQIHTYTYIYIEIHSNQ